MTEDDPRYLAMSPRERASFDALSGGTGGGGRRYDPHDRSLFSGPGFGRRIDGNHFAAMREYYTRGQRDAPSPPQKAGAATHVKKQMLALPPGPKMLAITQFASC